MNLNFQDTATLAAALLHFRNAIVAGEDLRYLDTYSGFNLDNIEEASIDRIEAVLFSED